MRPVKFIVKEGVYVESRDPEGRHPDKPSWAIITSFGMCYNRDNKWEYEPTPSNRDEKFYERCRFTFEEAEALAEKAAETVERKRTLWKNST